MAFLTIAVELATCILPSLVPNPEAIARRRFKQRYGIDAWDNVLGSGACRFLDARLAMPGWSWTLKVKSHLPENHVFIVGFTDDGSIHGTLRVSLSVELEPIYTLEWSSLRATLNENKKG